MTTPDDDPLPGQLSFDDAAAEHHHLAVFGFTICHDPACSLPRDDPANDMACTDPDPASCGGSCAGAQFNADRRAHLIPVPLAPWDNPLPAADRG
jgi:hypothetical protein